MLIKMLLTTGMDGFAFYLVSTLGLFACGAKTKPNYEKQFQLVMPTLL